MHVVLHRTLESQGACKPFEWACAGDEYEVIWSPAERRLPVFPSL